MDLKQKTRQTAGYFLPLRYLAIYLTSLQFALNPDKFFKNYRKYNTFLAQVNINPIN
jgi:hypothetical protein